MELTPILITNILATKTGFAETENGDQVFIPSKIVTIHNLNIGESVSALLAHNTINPEKTPWIAIKIIEDENKTNELTDFIVHELNENGRATINELSNISGKPLNIIQEEMNKLKTKKIVSSSICWDIVDQ